MRFLSRKQLIFNSILVVILLGFAFYLLENSSYIANGKRSLALMEALRRMDTNKWSTQFIDDVMTYRRKRFDLYQKTQWNRTGPGEYGKPVKLSDEEYKKAKELLSKTGGSFRSVTDMISLDRALPDPRSERCRQIIYPKFNLTVSVIVTYCNDAPSLILRTAHSVVNRSPPDYLKEVLLINDHSDHLELGDLLEQAVSVTWPDGIVKVIRTNQRRGVAGARMVGIENAQGDIILSLDSHIEVFPGWLEPLISRLQENPDALICPTLGGIHYKTFEVNPGGHMIWDFSWDMMNRPAAPLKRLPPQPIEPFVSMASTGGAWAMMRKTFLDLGGYDPGMSAWGGEDFEMALRVWLCTKNGRVEMVPCSHVAHVFRGGPRPYHTNNETDTDYGLRNFQRTAEIWLDEYKPIFYYKQPLLKKKIFGDISHMMKLRKELGCRDFRWFLTNIATHKKVLNIQDIKRYGRIQSVSEGTCLDRLSHDLKRALGLYACSENAVYTQFFIYIPRTKELLIQVETCIEYPYSEENKRPQTTSCSGSVSEQWTYNEDKKQFVHSSGLCLDATDPKRDEHAFPYVTLKSCNGQPSQQWTWQDVKRPD